jgi:RNA polymerase sigma factor (TIGR02999 family)
VHDRTEITLLLSRAGAGDANASARLMEVVYEELRALAGSYARGGRPDQTLQPTALVHEAFLRLVDVPAGEWTDRAHFFAVAATAMRQVLADQARRRGAQKRGSGWDKVTLAGVALPGERDELDLLALDAALVELAAFDERKHRVVELRFFGGLTVEEVAQFLGLSVSTIESEWRAARSWLAVRLNG